MNTEQSDVAYWFITEPALFQNNVAGLRQPDAAVGLVIDGYSTSNGEIFDYPPFEGGRQDGTFIIFEDVGLADKLFQAMQRYATSRKSIEENLSEDNEFVVARWNLNNGKIALFVGDSEGSQAAQETFHQHLSFNNIPFYSNERTILAQSFDAQALLRKEEVIFSPEAREALEELLSVTPALTPKKTTL